MSSPTLQNYTAYSDLTAGIPVWYAEKIQMDAESKEFWSKLEGAEGSDSVIIRRDGRLNQSGSAEYFTTAKQMYGAGVTGETELRGNEEKYVFDDYTLTVEWLRHAISFTEKARKRSIADLSNLASPMLAGWLARRKDKDLDYQLITTETSAKTLYGGSYATTANDLNSDCTFGWEELQKGYAQLESMGAEPYEVTNVKGETFPVYGVCITERDAYHLRGDGMWIKANCEAAIRAENNAIFTNAIGMAGGILVYVRRGIQGKPISYLRPEARIYTTHTAVVTTITVGSSDGRDYTQMFPSTGTLAITPAAGGATEFVSYTGKTAYTFTGCTRGASLGHKQDGSTDVTSTAATYIAGDLVTLGKHQSTQIFFGKNIAYRCFASPFQTVTQKDDYGFISGIGIAGEFGQTAIKDTADVPTNYVVMKCNSQPYNATDYGV